MAQGSLLTQVNIKKYGGTATTLGQKAMAASIPVVIASDQSAVPISGTVAFSNTTIAVTNAGTFAVQVSSALPAGTNVIGHVIVDSGAITFSNTTIAVTNTGTFAVQATLSAETTKVIGVVRNADGAGNLWTSNSTTYTAKFGQDVNLLGTLGTAFSTAGKVDVKGADGDVFVRQATAANLNATVVGTGTFTVQATISAGSAVIGHVIVDSGSITFSNTSIAVTNAGTFAVQATLSAETTKVIGTVNIAASQTIAVTNAGTFVVQATLAAETTKVIGTVRTADGAGNLFTTNSNTYTAKFAQDINLLGTLGTAFSTAGKVDVKGADGDVFVRQTTAANLNATVVGTGTFAAQVTVAASATNIAKAEDAASADADVGVPAMAVRKASPANTSGTDGDYEMLQISAGRLWVSAVVDTALPAGTNVIGHVITDTGSTTVVTGTVTVSGAVTNTVLSVVGGGTEAAAQRVTIANDSTGVLAVKQSTAANLNATVVGTGTFAVQATLAAETTKVIGTVNISASQSVTTIPTTSGTSTPSNVAGSATSVTVLASNSSRKGGTVYNDSTAILYLLLNSGSASTTSFTTKLFPDDYFEIPFNYTGALTGIWASATGSARVTEFT